MIPVHFVCLTVSQYKERFEDLTGFTGLWYCFSVTLYI